MFKLKQITGKKQTHFIVLKILIRIVLYLKRLCFYNFCTYYLSAIRVLQFFSIMFLFLLKYFFIVSLKTICCHYYLCYFTLGKSVLLSGCLFSIEKGLDIFFLVIFNSLLVVISNFISRFVYSVKQRLIICNFIFYDFLLCFVYQYFFSVFLFKNKFNIYFLLLFSLKIGIFFSLYYF